MDPGDQSGANTKQTDDSKLAVYFSETRTYIGDYIKHADAKAQLYLALAIGVVTVVLARLGTAGVNGWCAWLLLASATVYAGVVVLCVAAVFPRIRKVGSDYSFPDIAARDEQWLDSGAPEDAAGKARKGHLRALARIAVTKYKILQWVTIAVLVGGVLASIGVVVPTVKQLAGKKSQAHSGAKAANKTSHKPNSATGRPTNR